MILMHFSEEEVQQLIKAWAVLSFSFALAFTRSLPGLGVFSSFLFSGVTVGVSFVVHELAHKFLAQRFNCWAEFRSFDLGLLLTIFTAWTSGFIFALPGAVVISGITTNEENGKIAAIGPISNIVLSLLFYLAAVLWGPRLFLSYGGAINARLALFNLLPFGFMDGLKVYNWDLRVWVGLFGLALILNLGL